MLLFLCILLGLGRNGETSVVNVNLDVFFRETGEFKRGGYGVFFRVFVEVHAENKISDEEWIEEIGDGFSWVTYRGLRERGAPSASPRPIRRFSLPES